MAVLVTRLSGSGFDTVPASLRVTSFTPLSSSPDLFRRSTCSWAAEEHVDDRDKPAHDEVKGRLPRGSTTDFTEPDSVGRSIERRPVLYWVKSRLLAGGPDAGGPVPSRPWDQLQIGPAYFSSILMATSSASAGSLPDFLRVCFR